MKTMNESAPPSSKVRVRRSPEVARREILEAARAEIGDAQDGRISVSAIMRRVGMRQPSFYHYFQSLDEVIEELLLEASKDIRDAIEPWLSRTNASLDKREATIVHMTNMLAVGKRHRQIVSAALRATNSSERVFGEWRSKIMTYYFERARQTIEAEVEAGRSNVTDPAGVAKALILMNFGAWMDDLWSEEPVDPIELGKTVGRVWNDMIYGRD